MENYQLENDVYVVCVTARAFPEGIMDAFKQLGRKYPSLYTQPFYGISYETPEGDIIYKAAALERFEGEGKKLGLETFVISKGEYITETIFDFSKDPKQIFNCFQRLLSVPQLDKHFPCVEWYKSEDEVMCMVKAVEKTSDKLV